MPITLILITFTFSIFSGEYYPVKIERLNKPSIEICLEDASVLDNGRTVRAYCTFSRGK